MNLKALIDCSVAAVGATTLPLLQSAAEEIPACPKVLKVPAFVSLETHHNRPNRHIPAKRLSNTASMSYRLSEVLENSHPEIRRKSEG